MKFNMGKINYMLNYIFITFRNSIIETAGGIS